jgi:6-pyruvoyltetrahydropterin/6-carboxytetrahydropterin synthase
MIRVTRGYRFAASHRLHSPALSDEQNRELYGRCNNPFGHGHNYEIEVRVRGPIETRNGRAVDLERLDSLVRREVLEPFDHRNLSEEIAELRAEPATAENLGREIVRRLKQNWRTAFPGEWPRLDGVRIGETSRNFFEVSSDEIE